MFMKNIKAKAMSCILLSGMLIHMSACTNKELLVESLETVDTPVQVIYDEGSVTSASKSSVVESGEVDSSEVNSKGGNSSVNSSKVDSSSNKSDVSSKGSTSSKNDSSTTSSKNVSSGSTSSKTSTSSMNNTSSKTNTSSSSPNDGSNGGSSGGNGGKGGNNGGSTSFNSEGTSHETTSSRVDTSSNGDGNISSSSKVESKTEVSSNTQINEGVYHEGDLVPYEVWKTFTRYTPWDEPDNNRYYCHIDKNTLPDDLKAYAYPFDMEQIMRDIYDEAINNHHMIYDPQLVCIERHYDSNGNDIGNAGWGFPAEVVNSTDAVAEFWNGVAPSEYPEEARNYIFGLIDYVGLCLSDNSGSNIIIKGYKPNNWQPAIFFNLECEEVSPNVYLIYMPYQFYGGISLSYFEGMDEDDSIGITEDGRYVSFGGYYDTVPDENGDYVQGPLIIEDVRYHDYLNMPDLNYSITRSY